MSRTFFVDNSTTTRASHKRELPSWESLRRPNLDRVSAIFDGLKDGIGLDTPVEPRAACTIRESGADEMELDFI